MGLIRIEPYQNSLGISACFKPLLPLLVSCILFGGTHANAADSPSDPNLLTSPLLTSQSLTVEQARTLAQAYPGMYEHYQVLELKDLKTLDADVARALAEYGRGRLLLNSLTTLDAATAQALAQCKGGLSLNGLTTLNAATAQALAQCKSGLSLNGLTTLDAATAQALAACSGESLVLDGLKTLDVAIAEVLAQAKCESLSFKGLTTLDAVMVQALTRFSGELCLPLYGLTTLDAATAQALAEYSCPILAFNSLTTLDAATAQALAKYQGRALAFDELTTLDAATAQALATSKVGILWFRQLTTLDAAATKALTGFNGELWLPLDCLTALDAATAQTLAKKIGPQSGFDNKIINMQLRGSKMSDVVKWLSQLCDVPITVDAGLGVQRISFRLEGIELTQALQFLAKVIGGEVKPQGKGYRIVPAAASPDAIPALPNEGKNLSFNGLTTLDAATAQALAEFKGQGLSLNGLTTLDAATAQVLATIDARRSAPVQGLEEQNETWRKEINNQLEQEVTLDFQDSDLVDVIDFLQRITSMNIVLDPQVITAAPPPVTLRVEAMKLRFVMDFIMKLTGLNYTLRNEAIFISNIKGSLWLNGLTTLDATTAQALAEFKGERLSLDGLKTLDVATAKVLAQAKCERLDLDGLSTLDAATAGALAQFKGKTLSLRRLKTLDAAADQALAQFAGKLIIQNGKSRAQGPKIPPPKPVDVNDF